MVEEKQPGLKPSYLHRFTVDDYHHMAASGLLAEDQPVELIYGQIIDMSPINSRHAGTVNLLNRLLSARLDKQYILGVQNPIHLDEFNEPEPDLAIMKFREDFYVHDHPLPSDVLLLIEVADTSLNKDRELKLPLYATAGIPEVWILNLQDGQLECYTEPKEGSYQSTTIKKTGTTLQHTQWGEFVVERLVL